jgi:predicted dithiol-disulfide oxidoreductase (DUF899 family)
MTTPSESNHHPGETPPVVEAAAWQTARDELMAREKAHMREGDAISAARRRLPMVEVDGTAEVVGFNGPVAFIDLFQGRDVLLVHKHMWHDGIPIEGQCMGCTINTWHIQRSAVYLRARGVSLAVLTTGRWEEVAQFVESWGTPSPGTRRTACHGRSVKTWGQWPASSASARRSSSPMQPSAVAPRWPQACSRCLT